ncbi:MAG: polymer-forming cytoskeletal protein [Candidatus Eisenbacteria bacterium]
MANDTKNPARGRSLAQRVAAKALGLDATEMDGSESRGGLKNPFARDRERADEGEDEDIVANCHIGAGSSFRGTLMIEGTLLVDGDFEGDILNCDRIIVGPYGHVRADVHVREAVVAGVFDGGIQAEERIDLLRGARVRGDLTSHAIVIDEGVRFSGRCTMLDENPNQESGGSPGNAGGFGAATRGGTPRSAQSNPGGG